LKRNFECNACGSIQTIDEDQGLYLNCRLVRYDPTEGRLIEGNVKLKYDLKKPCKDCPFLQGSELHQGIAKAIPEYIANLEMDRFAHTCHKTDPRTDSPEGQAFKGDIQHCAGSIAMMAQGSLTAQSHVIDNVPLSRWNKLKATPGTYRSFQHFLRTYVNWLKAGHPAGKTAADYEGVSNGKDAKT